MKYLLIAIGLLFFECALGQVVDDFSDGNFNSDPVWTGTNDFDASDGTLKLNATGAGSSYLTTPQSQLSSTTWEFLVHFDFNPSSTSLAKVFLTSNTSDLSGDLEGYFVMVGNTEDEISLYKKDGTNETYIINGTDDVIDASTVHVRIKVTRDESGQWELFHDTTGGTSYTKEGDKTTDNSFTSSSYFGVYCKYTATRTTAIYFDDFFVNSQPESFEVSEVILENAQTLRVIFNQSVDQTSAENKDNYEVNFGYFHPHTVTQDVSNQNEVLLIFETPFVNNKYTLSLSNIENNALDEIIEEEVLAFSVTVQTIYRNIVINEIMADPTPVVGLPDAEYIELYNPSNHAINLLHFEIDSREIENDFVLESKEYVTLTANDNVDLFSGNVIGLSGLSLSNSGESLQLIDNLGNLVDSVSYTSDWYQNAEKKDGGYALEQINPEKECSTQSNWTASENPNGGTPGIENSVFDLTPDTKGPNLIHFSTVDDHTFRLTFDESMDESSLLNASYQFNPTLEVSNVTPISPGYVVVLLEVSSDLINGVEYTIVIEDATDCSGNLIDANSLSLVFDTSPPQLERIEVKNSFEVNLHFNENLELVSAEKEENYISNHSESLPKSAILKREKQSIINLKWEEGFIWGNTNTIVIQNISDQNGNEIETAISSSFVLKQDIDSVYVIGSNLLDIRFDSELNLPAALEKENYSISDDIGFPTSVFIDEGHDHMIHLAFSKNFEDNKKLLLSTSNLLNDKEEYLTTPDIYFVYDTSPPKVDTVIVLSSNQLEVIFSERVDQSSAASKENYEYNENYPNDISLGSDLKSIRLKFDEEFQREVVYELLLNHIKDLYGNAIKTRIKYEFVYDIFSPELDSIIVRSAKQLILHFNEKLDINSAENVSNFSIGEDNEIPLEASLDKEFLNVISLLLENPLSEEEPTSIEIFNMKDLRGNSSRTALSSTIDFTKFYISQIDVLSQNQIKIEFNKSPNDFKYDITNYKVNDGSIKQITFQENRLATIELSTELKDNTIHYLSIRNIEDSNANDLAFEDYTFEFNSHYQSSTLVGDRTIAISFDQPLDDKQIFDLSKFSSNPSLGNCVAAIVDSDDSKLLKLTFEKAIHADEIYFISWKDVINNFDRALPNFYTYITKDETPPAVIDFFVLDENSMWVKFSENLIKSSAEFSGNYMISPNVGQPQSIKYVSSDSSILMDFSSKFEETKSYVLQIDNLKDLSYNSLNNHKIDFQYILPDAPEFGDLIITEIMADPTPEVGLSEKEYIEIFNTTDHTISLKGIQLSDQSGTTTIVEGELENGNYAVLCSTSNTGEFKGVQAIGVSNFPSLNNSGETLTLISSNGVVFSTSYSKDWYKDEKKSEGGWSLEMIDIKNPCGEYNNWMASLDVLGGTPGKVNSVQNDNPDNFGPQLISAIATDSVTLLLNFNEKIHPHSIENAIISLNPEIAFNQLQSNTPTFTNLELQLSSNLKPKQTYKVEISNLTDCLKNPIQKEHNSTKFNLTEEASEKDIIINEVLFNPRTNGVDFVEIYNDSDKTIDLIHWTISDGSDQLKPISNEHFIIDPGKYVALTTDAEILIHEYPKGDPENMITADNFPALNDTEDSVILFDKNNVIIDQMYYQNDFHFSLLENTEGVSLERISFQSESFDKDSWKSAASTVGFATPGRENSQTQKLASNPGTLSIEPKVFIPNNDGINDYTTISYEFERSGLFANVLIYNVNGMPIKTLAQNELLSTSGFFIWDGTTDQGSLASVGYYLVVFENYDGQGNQQTLKQTLVLGTQF